jgi:predicted transposase YbfD/YdcC
MVEATRTTTAAQSCSERRHYLSSLTNAERIAATVRQHWHIENQQHWVLDVQFGEDNHRARKNHSAANLALLRRAALNLLRQDPSNKLSIRRRKMRALSNLPYRQYILFGPALLSCSP